MHCSFTHTRGAWPRTAVALVVLVGLLAAILPARSYAADQPVGHGDIAVKSGHERAIGRQRRRHWSSRRQLPVGAERMSGGAAVPRAALADLAFGGGGEAVSPTATSDVEYNGIPRRAGMRRSRTTAFSVDYAARTRMTT